jgi:hypothetical protein
MQGRFMNRPLDRERSGRIKEIKMRKQVLMIVMISLALCLSACNRTEENAVVPSESIEVSQAEKEEQSAEETEIAMDDTSVESEAKTEGDTANDSADTAEDMIHDGIDMDRPPINWGTPDGPEIAAEHYYQDTVFELVSLDVLQSSTEYVKFSVVSKKDGAIVEPNRTIELRYENDVWAVVNEGY